MKRAICAACILLALSSCGKKMPAAAPMRAQLDRVIDGNTLVVVTAEGVSETVRLIGVRVPGREGNRRAATWLRWAYDEGYPLLLTFDTQERDKDGRLLAYVFAGKGTEGVSPEKVARMNERSQSMHALMIDGRVYGFVNASLIKGGRAQPARESRNTKYADLFRNLHQASVDRQ